MAHLNIGRLSQYSLMFISKLISQHGAFDDIIKVQDEEQTERLRFLQQSPHRASPPRAAASTISPQRPVIAPASPGPQQPMPSTADTLQELKRRLAKELYRFELDLQGGGRIPSSDGKLLACDCLGHKHHLGIEATAEELMSYEVNPVYSQIIAWMNSHAPVFDPAEIVNHPPEYYQAMTPEVRAFRKEVMGTEQLSAMLSDGDRQKIVAKMKEMEG